MTAIAKLKALTNLVWNGGEKGKDYQFEDKKGTWMGRGNEMHVLVHCKTRDRTLTYGGTYNSITNELAFSPTDVAESWEGVIHFNHFTLPVNGPYILWKNGKEWIPKNWQWWRNTAIGSTVLLLLLRTNQLKQRKVDKLQQNVQSLTTQIEENDAYDRNALGFIDNKYNNTKKEMNAFIEYKNKMAE